MRSIERTFRTYSVEFPQHGSYINFFRSIANRGYTRRTIIEWFDRLVDPDDYDPKDRKILIKGLVSASQRQTAKKRGAAALPEAKIT